MISGRPFLSKIADLIMARLTKLEKYERIEHQWMNVTFDQGGKNGKKLKLMWRWWNQNFESFK